MSIFNIPVEHSFVHEHVVCLNIIKILHRKSYFQTERAWCMQHFCHKNVFFSCGLFTLHLSFTIFCKKIVLNFLRKDRTVPYWNVNKLLLHNSFTQKSTGKVDARNNRNICTIVAQNVCKSINMGHQVFKKRQYMFFNILFCNLFCKIFK